MEKQEFQVGDIVYCIDEDYKGFEDRVVSVSLEGDGSISYTCDEGWEFYKEHIGKEVFKTSEERSNYFLKH